MERVQQSNNKQQSSSSLIVPVTSSPQPSLPSVKEPEETHDVVTIPDSHETQRKPGGWKSMPYVLGNESFERLATYGLSANFMVYFLTQLHMDQVSATNLINIWTGITNFAPLIGAFISDASAGRFRTIAVASIASFLGMLTITLTAGIPNLHPPACTKQQQQLDQCIGPTRTQLGVLLMGLGLLSIGTGGIRPCSLPFGVDQFDSTTEEGRKGINSFYNWYYTSFTLVLMLAFTVVVYIQDSVSWAWGFGVPTMLMFGSITLFFLGTRMYVYVKPEGSVFSGIAQVLVAAYKKRRLKLPATTGEVVGVYYDSSPLNGSVVSKLPLTKQFRFLNKAAVIVGNEVNPDGYPSNKWRLCSIQQVEEVKCLIKVVPIWASGIICFTATTQQGTFSVSQALKMDRHLGPNFQIPAGSISVISMLTVLFWLPFYDRILVPALRKITGHEGGITLLQRMGIGIVLSIVTMVAAGLIERRRRASAISHFRADGVAAMSVMWLCPQLILMGLSESFNIIGQIEFYNKQFPEHMKTIANSLFFCTIGGASYLSSFMISIVDNITGKDGWLTKDINTSRVDYFYYLIAGMGVFNLIYFLVCAHRYRYKISVPIVENGHLDVELNSING